MNDQNSEFAELNVRFVPKADIGLSNRPI